jgi:heme-degrading monooxygenase HmoA
VTGPTFARGQVVTVFRSYLRDEPDPGYEALNDAMHRRVHELGGLVEVKSFAADDGERVTLVTFEDRAAHERWASDAAHRRAQQLGRSAVYRAYSVQVADCTAATSFVAAE